MKKLDLIDKASIPLFVATMLAEAAILKGRKKREFGDLKLATNEELSELSLPADPLIPVGYEESDTKASLTMLVGNIAFNLSYELLLTRGLSSVYGRRIANASDSKASLAKAMLVWDFLYYWDHRWMHEVRLFWANHVTHHSSERYNLSTALRQPWSGILLFWVFLPMPILGFSAKQIHRAGQLNLLYQYWIHTELIDRLPAPLEAVLNTPSHHRVHHGANPQYLDKNYGGILILWDKLFGTFEPEVRRIKYGLTKNIDTYKPLKIAYHEFTDIASDIKSAKSWRDRVKYTFGRPGWQPAAA